MLNGTAPLDLREAAIAEQTKYANERAAKQKAEAEERRLDERIRSVVRQEMVPYQNSQHVRAFNGSIGEAGIDEAYKRLAGVPAKPRRCWWCCSKLS